MRTFSDVEEVGAFFSEPPGPVNADWITSSEAAKHLGYTVQHVRRLLRDGQLEGRKLGRDWAISRESVNEYLAERENLDLPLDATDQSPGETQ